MTRSRSAGVTLIEMLMVVSIVALFVAISFPAVSSGLDTVRLGSATNSVVTFFNSALNRADRRQEPIEVIISIEANNLEMRSPDPAFTRKIDMPDGIKIDKIYPLPAEGYEEKARSVIVYPAGAVPRIGVEIRNSKGTRRIVRIDPITGIAQVEEPQS
ncbi:MAG TPA: prepilin-type N-terminal cleavage/methylation domain-containing protein [Bryobacteraceae bacterium]|nr:prepilin-type N-terminal cleavage/methylation domain-containing protein [Bryobacteraceae bacterium]